ncbi:glycosyltransferase [Caldilinea sp.]|jgi:glycosyltransferase involved in cell wall biosynthesis|uniref:glycosyltransferase n=1 Tax=Caldilinea sp. TaxID=2293560 RepID=UPI0021DC4070|nr:glycosyltransferase [Caldilinea sp.]GIV68007.1 MAG: glycosyl transferase [Caldilinea sp.]
MTGDKTATMRILLVGQSYYRKDNGQAVFTIRLAEGLAAVGQEVMVLAPSEKGVASRCIVNGVIVQKAPALHIGYNLNITAFSDSLVESVLDEFRPDIVHIQDHLFLSRTALRLARRRNLPVVGTNHFLPNNWSNNLYIPRSVQGVVHKAMWRNMLEVFNQLDAATTPTETAVAILRKQDIRIPVKAISCGVNQNEFYPRPDLDPAIMRRRYGLALDRTLFLYVGRVDREKGLDDLVDAAEILKHEPIQFVIAGKGLYRDILLEHTNSRNLNHVVVFPGFVPSEDLPLLINSCDAFIMPSAQELQSIATLEAMSCAKPVLAANARALPELVEHGVNGYLFSPFNPASIAGAVQLFLSKRERWAEMGEASLAKSRPHHLSNTVQRYIEWYESVIGRPVYAQMRQPDQQMSVTTQG